jgi:hypothetical protein
VKPENHLNINLGRHCHEKQVLPSFHCKEQGNVLGKFSNGAEKFRSEVVTVTIKMSFLAMDF